MTERSNILRVQLSEKARQETSIRNQLATLEVPEGAKIDDSEYFRYKMRRDLLQSQLAQVSSEIEELKNSLEEEPELTDTSEDNAVELAKIAAEQADALRKHQASEAQAIREHEEKMAIITHETARENRLAAEAAAKLSSQQFDDLLKGLKDDEA